jgi:hypothetical protein
MEIVAGCWPIQTHSLDIGCDISSRHSPFGGYQRQHLPAVTRDRTSAAAKCSNFAPEMEWRASARWPGPLERDERRWSVAPGRLRWCRLRSHHHLDLDLIAHADAEIRRLRDGELGDAQRELRLDSNAPVLFLQLRGAGDLLPLSVQKQREEFENGSSSFDRLHRNLHRVGSRALARDAGVDVARVERHHSRLCERHLRVVPAFHNGAIGGNNRACR